MVIVRPVLHLVGMLLLVLAGAMLLPAIVDVHGDNWNVFFTSSLVTGFVGITFVIAYQPSGAIILNTRQAFFLTTGAWIIVCLFGSLPFLFSSLGMSLADAYFETMSGLTTTGSTVIVGLDSAPPGILLWRGLLQGLGGVGMIVMAVAVLPDLRIGGMQLFRMESSNKTEKVVPRVSQMAGSIAILYMLFVVICSIALWVSGMSWLEAIIHAMAALATGGLSTSDDSIGHFNNPLIEWILIVFMMIGATPFVLFIALWHYKWKRLVHDSQVRWFYLTVVIIVSFLTIWLWTQRNITLSDALRLSAFNVVSIITTTGFTSEDYTSWGSFAQAIFFILTFVGGCTGSTAGAIKIFRFQVLISLATVQFKKLLQPTGVFLISFEKEQIANEDVHSVQGFVVLYGVCFIVLASVLVASGLDIVTALSGSATTLGNVGPGLGDIIGPSGTFKTLSNSTKWVLSFAMLLGRLELLTVLVLLRRDFWREY